MNKFFIRLAVVLLLPFGCLYLLGAQQASAESSEEVLEQQYKDYITGALRLQVKADSLTREANQGRRRLAFSGNDAEREKLSSQIMSLERESFRVQKHADSLYSQARAIEVRLTAGRQGRQYERSSPPGTVSGSTPSFLVLGAHNISHGLPDAELSYARELEENYLKANRLMTEVSEINNQIEQLSRMLDTNPRRRERRRINREIDEMQSRAFEMKMEAMQVYERVNSLRYSAAVNFLNDKREQISDSLVIRSGLEYEEIARESFRQAAGLRETAEDFRSDKYREGFTLRAYTEELKAFVQMEKALEIYQTPPPTAQGQLRELPLQNGGRIDPGTALSRSRAAAAASAQNQYSINNDDMQSAVFIDYGFSVFPESPYSAGNPLPAGFRLPDGIVYSIQIGIFRTILTAGSFGGLYPVMSAREPDNRSIRYFTGVFRSLPEAEKALLDVNQQGFSDAFIVAFNSGTRMPVSRARQMERDRLAREQAQNQSTTREQNQSQNPSQNHTQNQTPNKVQNMPRKRDGGIDPAMDTGLAADPDRVIFKVQLGAFSEIVQSGVYRNWQSLAGNKNVEYFRNNNGLYIYFIGNFNTFEEAAGMRSTARMAGINDAFVVPYKGDIRINMEEAKKLLLNQR